MGAMRRLPRVQAGARLADAVKIYLGTVASPVRDGCVPRRDGDGLPSPWIPERDAERVGGAR